jgi:uncharacterized membrane protein YbaN (DUF454 family)
VLKKPLFLVLGGMFTSLAFLGIFLPLLPTTPFLLLAAFFFLRSSQKYYDWLLNHKILGKYLKNYLENRAISLRIKVFTLMLLWGTISTTALFLVEYSVVKIGLLFIALAVTIHILWMKTGK